MNTLYLIGGSPRCGKTTIFNSFISKKPMIAIPTDAIRAGVRYLNKHNRINFSEDEIENNLPWEMIVGLIHRYDHKNIPLIIEGVVITPERVKNLKLENLKLQAVFVGFTEEAHIEKIIQYGQAEKDWVYGHIKNNNGDDTEIRKMFKSLQEKNKLTKEKAEEYGFGFFSPENLPFDEYCNKVVQNLLS
ncbi:hypothetical protein K8Q93_01185 [Candidatus Parcubacteria bacterium]|nr:hypothetical protein [Candidatus Parcubacteria bacterium]